MDVIKSPSPNFNARKLPVSLIILHYTGMETGAAALERMCDPDAQVSAHYMVEEDGRIFQLVDEDQRAWHAGVSYWRGERDINSASIGIEIVNGGHDFGLPAYPEIQIKAVTALVSDIIQRNAIALENIIGHSDIAPDRKQDPGEKFPWDHLAANGCARTMPNTEPQTGETANLLSQIGYNPDTALEDRVRAFQRRWRPDRVDGIADPETLDLIARLAAAS